MGLPLSFSLSKSEPKNPAMTFAEVYLEITSHRDIFSVFVYL